MSILQSMFNELRFLGMDNPNFDKSIDKPQISTDTGSSSVLADLNKIYLPFRGVKNDSSHFSPLRPEEKDIRYLRLEPGRGREPLQCYLEHTTLAKTPWIDERIRYEALSYCWDDVSNVVSILVHFPVAFDEDIEATTEYSAHQYRIMRNLQDALFALRMLEESRIIWVDAVCINQADREEKTLQVTMMNLIYSRAKEVIIWLGEDDTYCNLFVRYCQWDKSGPKWDRIRDMAAEQLTKSARKWVKGGVTPAAISNENLRDIVLDLFGQKYGPLANNSSFLQHNAAQVKEGFLHFISRPWFKSTKKSC
ncbi:hypothetical protein E8E11_011957 [Didymella keratinophila]|nr:hypothetical protein E8E11_011957 [Didymella keratinophila]